MLQDSLLWPGCRKPTPRALSDDVLAPTTNSPTRSGSIALDSPARREAEDLSGALGCHNMRRMHSARGWHLTYAPPIACRPPAQSDAGFRERRPGGLELQQQPGRVCLRGVAGQQGPRGSDFPGERCVAVFGQA